MDGDTSRRERLSCAPSPPEEPSPTEEGSTTKDRAAGPAAPRCPPHSCSPAKSQTHRPSPQRSALALCPPRVFPCLPLPVARPIAVAITRDALVEGRTIGVRPSAPARGRHTRAGRRNHL